MNIFLYKTAYGEVFQSGNLLTLPRSPQSTKDWEKGNTKILQIYPASWRSLFSFAKGRLC